MTEATCSGCQKNVPVLKRFFLQPTTVQPFMPHFRISKSYYRMQYNRSLGGETLFSVALCLYFLGKRRNHGFFNPQEAFPGNYTL
jgi:hypothetical protein